MGAWGHGNFENDEAADWVYEFEDRGAMAVVAALERVCELQDDDYLQAPEASAAAAAAEIVAAARDGDLSRLPEPVQEAVAQQRQTLAGGPLFESAQRAVARILQQSELKDVWKEGKDGHLWQSGMDSLSLRLR